MGESSRLARRPRPHRTRRCVCSGRPCERPPRREKHAVSRATLRPLSPRTNDSRLAARQSEVPTAVKASVCEGLLESIMPYSLIAMPTYTPVSNRERCGRNPRVLQDFPARFQQHSLLGVDSPCLAIRYTEEMVVEFVDPLQKATIAGIHCPGTADRGHKRRRHPSGQAAFPGWRPLPRRAASRKTPDYSHNPGSGRLIRR